jgi:hypothetical protein
MLVNKIGEKDKNIKVFYDKLEDLQGARLYDTFYSVFYEKSRYILVFMSEEYEKKEWAIHEFQAAKDRLIDERGKDYILPFKTDNTIISELKKIGYSELDEDNIEEHADRLISRIAK